MLFGYQGAFRDNEERFPSLFCIVYLSGMFIFCDCNPFGLFILFVLLCVFEDGKYDILKWFYEFR